MFRAAIVNLFIGFYLLFALFWDAPETSLIHRLVRARLGGLVRLLGLDHAWNMYTGPFVTISRLQTRVTFADKTTELVGPPQRYEFRRYYFMIGTRSSLPLYHSYLRVIERRLRASAKKVVLIEVIRQVSKAPVRRGGIRGTFEIQEAGPEQVVASWRRG